MSIEKTDLIEGLLFEILVVAERCHEIAELAREQDLLPDDVRRALMEADRMRDAVYVGLGNLELQVKDLTRLSRKRLKAFGARTTRYSLVRAVQLRQRLLHERHPELSLAAVREH